MGISLPSEMKVPPGVDVPFSWVRVRGNRAYVSGHGSLDDDGAPVGPFGKVPSEVPLDLAQQSARRATLAILSSLEAALGDLDDVSAWLSVTGFVNADPSYPQTTAVLNSCSDLLLDLYGLDRGRHARTAIGVSSVPLNLPVVIAAEVEIRERR
ncbi:MAG: RidA family protein [Acidimicrobiales bacterium]